MTLAACWLLLPLTLGLASFGCGLVLERAAGVRIPGPLLAPAGLAVVIALSGFTTAFDTTADLTTPLVCLLGAAGLVLLARGPSRLADGWALGAAAGVYVAFALPVVASGQATFAGYIKLDDTATWLAISDHVLEHGRNLSGLAPSSYEATLSSYVGNGYPLGSFVPLAIAHSLIGQDTAWLFQPLMAFYGAMIALTLYAVAAPMVRSGRSRALVAFIASQPALLFGYSLWGGLKEIAIAWLIALVAVLLAGTVRAAGPRALLLPAVAVAALLTVASAAAGVWILAPAFVTLAIWARGPGLRIVMRRGLALVALTALLAAPALLLAGSFLSDGGVHTLTGDTELGNLAEPLEPIQALGVWPAGDFRFDPESKPVTYVLVGLVALSAAAAVLAACRRRAWALVLFVAGAAAGCGGIAAFGSPWVDAKAFAVASPAPVLAGMVGAVLAWNGGRRVAGALLAVAIAGGVVWSNALAYGEVNLAPRERLAELERIGERFAGRGPTLMTEYEPYGVRHFLRGMDPEGASEFRRRQILLRNGRSLAKLEFADIDEFKLETILVYRSLVLRRSPFASRPPSIYRLVARDRYYDVWQRPNPVRRGAILAHLALGARDKPAETARCATVRGLARLAGPNGTIVAAPGGNPSMRNLGNATRSPSWARYGGDTRIVLPLRAAVLATALAVPRAGDYRAWVGGAFRRLVELDVDGRRIALRRHRLSHANQFEPMGSVRLAAGRHTLTLRYGGRDLRPGSRGAPFPIGPLALSPTADPGLLRFSAGNARSLCGRSFDWLEVTR
jgi:hypothetical protein